MIATFTEIRMMEGIMLGEWSAGRKTEVQDI